MHVFATPSFSQPNPRDTPAEASFAALDNDLYVDVAVVGGGVTGVTAALLLKRAGKRVALLACHTVGASSAPHTTAHLSAILSTRYQDLVATVGVDTARLVAKSSTDVITRIADFVRDERIDCGFTWVPGYLYTESARERALIEDEVEVARALGLPARLTDELPLPFGVAAAMELPNQVQLDSLAYVRALAALIPGDGSYVFEDTCVTHVHDGAPCRVHAAHGTVAAQNVLIAAQTPRDQLAAWEPKITPYRSYVLGVELREPLSNGLFWDTMDPYHATRAAHDVRGDMVIVGGEDHKLGPTFDTEMHERQLEDYVRARFDVVSVVHRWSEQGYYPASGLPFTDLYAARGHVYTAADYGDNAITFGTLSAMVLSDALLGRASPWQTLDAGQLKPSASGKRTVSGKADVFLHACAVG